MFCFILILECRQHPGFITIKNGTVLYKLILGTYRLIVSLSSDTYIKSHVNAIYVLVKTIHASFEKHVPEVLGSCTGSIHWFQIFSKMRPKFFAWFASVIKNVRDLKHRIKILRILPRLH